MDTPKELRMLRQHLRHARVTHEMGLDTPMQLVLDEITIQQRTE